MRPKELLSMTPSLIVAVVVMGAAMVSAAHSDPMLDTLVSSYPDHLAGYENGYLLWKDGTRMAVSDDRREKTFEQLLDAPDILDQFAIRYPLGTPTAVPGVDQSPVESETKPSFERCTGIVKRVRLRANSARYRGCPIAAEASFWSRR